MCDQVFDILRPELGKCKITYQECCYNDGKFTDMGCRGWRDPGGYERNAPLHVRSMTLEDKVARLISKVPAIKIDLTLQDLNLINSDSMDNILLHLQLYDNYRYSLNPKYSRNERQSLKVDHLEDYAQLAINTYRSNELLKKMYELKHEF